MGARLISRPALLAPVAGSWQGGRRSGRHHLENLQSKVQLGRFFTRRGGARGGWRSVGIMGRAELCGANNKRDTTPEGWLFLKLLDVLGGVKVKVVSLLFVYR